MLEFIKDVELIKANPYKTAKIKKLHTLPAFGINSSMYGGRVNSIAELANSDLFLIVDNNCNTIDLARIKVEKPKEKFRKVQ